MDEIEEFPPTWVFSSDISRKRPDYVQSQKFKSVSLFFLIIFVVWFVFGNWIAWCREGQYKVTNILQAENTYSVHVGHWSLMLFVFLYGFLSITSIKFKIKDFMLCYVYSFYANEPYYQRENNRSIVEDRK